MDTTEVMEKYGDIIDLEHPQVLARPRMSLSKRASQFAPFAALKGYEELLLKVRLEQQAEADK